MLTGNCPTIPTALYDYVVLLRMIGGIAFTGFSRSGVSITSLIVPLTGHPLAAGKRHAG